MDFPLKAAERKWSYMDDPSDPCVYCVQWICAEHDWDCDDYFDHPDAWVPTGGPGWVAHRVWKGTCDSCKAAIAGMMEDQAAEWRWRDGKPCGCGHDGAEHDYDEVGECSRCGCAAWHDDG